MRLRIFSSIAVVGLAGVSLFGCSSKSSSDSTIAPESVAESVAETAAAVASESTVVGAETSAAALTGDTAAPASGASALPLDTEAFAGTDCPATDGSAPRHTKFAAEPKMCIDVAKKYVALMETSKGNMTFDLDPKRAPKTVNSFVFLARQHYFEGIKFHRVVPNFVLQAGDPLSIIDDPRVGSGGPGYEFADELPQPGEYKVGSLVMANAGPNTNGSQFFIVSGPNGVTLPPNYALFGQLSDGQSTVDAIGALAVTDGPPSEPVIINKVTITES
jgi:peptidylprolyl isomerase/peptidyl-prolyl cis-trans isomerase B (cyclophilin B)